MAIAMHKKSLRAYLLALMAFCVPIWPSLHLACAKEEFGPGVSQTTNKSWEYDADGKLTRESISAAGTTRTCRYSHDGTGNRTEKDCDGQKTRYAYNSLEQLTEEQTATGPKTTYRWDGRGNLLEKSTPSATIRYEWSSDNRLLKASDGSTSIRYGYDALGRRISRTREAGGQKQETQWILDTARPYSEIVLERSRQNGGAWQETRYTHTPDGVGQLISEQRQGKTLHVYEDGQGSARLITDESGQIIETLDFDAFGNEEAGNPQESRHRYTGEAFDQITGLYHLRAREYDPKTGRFISMDEHPGSQSIPLTLNKYLYGNADPVNHVDPSGNIFTIAIAMPNVVSLRSQQIIVSGGQVYRANEALRRLAVGSVKQLKALRKAKAGFWKDMKNNEQIHHLIEKRIWQQSKELQKLFKEVGDILGVVLRKGEHQIFTNRWLKYFARKNMRGYKPGDISQQDIINAAFEIYKDSPAMLRQILLHLL